MRCLLLALATSLLLAGPPPGAGAQEACPPPRCHDVAVPVPDEITVPDSRIRVLLPSDYERSCASYPVLYLLHGVGDTFERWTERTDVVAFTEDLDLIVVMPDGGHGTEAGWYSDWQDGSRHWETFHTGVLIDFVEDTYRALGDRGRAVMGLSMGGFGAMSYAARHPGLYAAAASFSGAVDTMHGWPASGFAYGAGNEQFGTPDDRVWGNQVSDEEEWRDHNPTDRAADLEGTALFLASGTGTPGGDSGDDPENPGAYGVENAIFQMNVSFAAALTREGVDFEQDFYPGGYHGWPYWERGLHWALPQMLEVLGAAEGECAALAASASAPADPGPVLPATGTTVPPAAGLLLLVPLLARVARRTR